MSSWWSWLWRFVRGLALSLLILAALLNLAARIAMTQLDRFKPELALLFENEGFEGLELDRMSGEWRGWRPRFRFQGVRLQVPGRVLPTLAVSELELTVKPFYSLFSGRLKLADFHARIEELELRWDPGRLFEGRTASGGQPISPNLEQFLRALPDHLVVHIDRLDLLDARAGENLPMRNLELESRRWHGGRRLFLQGELPDTLGRTLNLRLDGDWQEQRLYVEADNLNLPRLAQWLPSGLPQLQSARADLRSWADFDAFQLMRVQTLGRVRDLRLRQDDKSAAATDALSLELRQLLLREENGWRNDLRLAGIRRGGQTLPPVNSQQFRDQRSGAWQVWVDRLDIAALTGWLQPLLDTEGSRLLARSQPSGEVKSLLLDFRPREPQDTRWSLDLQSIASHQDGKLPGLRNLTASLRGRGRYGSGRLASPGLRVDFGDLFRTPLQADVDAELRLSLQPGRLLLASPDFSVRNEDAALKGRLRLEVEPGQRPFLSLRAVADRANAAATGRYLPTRIMPPATVKWLDTAIQGGRLTRADLLFHGRTRSLKQLVASQSGEFDALLQIVDPQLEYRPGWPAVTRGRGELEFHNLGMYGQFEAVDFDRAQARRVEVAIPDMTRARLQLSTEAENDAQDLLDSLARVKELPLFQSLREPTESMAGPVGLQLDLDIPLSHKRQTGPMSVTADLDFRGVSWKAPDWLVDASDLRGRLLLKDRKLVSEGLKALYAGDPIQARVDGDLEQGRTRIDIDGRIQSAHLLGLLPPAFSAAFEGRSDWKLKLDLQQARASQPWRLDIRADSDLEGTAMTLPQPLSLTAEQRQPLHFEGRISARQYVDFRLDMSPRLRLAGRYDPIAEGDALQRIDYLNLLVGEGELPRGDAGLRLRGRIQRLDLDAWQGWLDRNARDIELSGEGLLSRVQQLDLNAGSLIWAGRELKDLSLDSERQGSYLAGRLKSSLASGTLRWPLVSGPELPIVAELDYLRLPRSDASELREWQPKLEDMPNLVLVSREFRWREMEFSDLVIHSVNDGESFEVQRLDLRKDQVVLRATGHWQHNGLGGDDITVFNISIKGDQFGQVVQKLGLGETLSGGRIDFFGQIGWGGAIDDIRWDTLIGEVSLTLKDGYLRNVDPGAGRFVGLLSFSALPRRLYLDFGDVVREGLQFRKIKGKFRIQGEILSTENAWMDSPSAKVRIKGITNLRTKTYDQTMYIIPKLGDTLPVIGAIAGGSSLGWGILLLQKIFKKPIDKSVEIEYRVTGPWDDPKIELIKKPEKAREQDNEEPFDSNPNS